MIYPATYISNGYGEYVTDRCILARYNGKTIPLKKYDSEKAAQEAFLNIVDGIKKDVNIVELE